MLHALENHANSWIPGRSITSHIMDQSVFPALMDHVVSFPFTMAKTLVTGALIFFLSFYWLVASPGINSWIRSLFPESVHPDVTRVLKDISWAMGGYLRGVAINAFVVALLVWLGLRGMS